MARPTTTDLDREKPMRRRPKWTRTLACLAAVATVLLATTGIATWRQGTTPDSGDPATAGTAGLLRAAAQRSGDVPLPDDCRPTADPPPTEYGFVATVTEGSVTGGVMKLTGLTARMCGIIRVVDGTHPGCEAEGKLIIPSDGVVFPDDLRTTLTVVPGMSPEVPTRVHAHPIEQVINCNGSSKDGLKLTLSIRVDGKAGAFGLRCAIPFSGTARTTITGDLLSGDYTGEFTLVGKHFHAGTVANNDKYCPGELPSHVNRIAQLPGKNYDVRMSGTVAIYQRPAS